MTKCKFIVNHKHMNCEKNLRNTLNTKYCKIKME